MAGRRRPRKHRGRRRDYQSRRRPLSSNRVRGIRVATASRDRLTTLAPARMTSLTMTSKIRSQRRLELLLLLRCLRRFLLTFRHCCPPSHVTWRVSHSVHSRIDMHCTVITTAQRKKPRLHLMKSVRASPSARRHANDAHDRFIDERQHERNVSSSRARRHDIAKLSAESGVFAFARSPRALHHAPIYSNGALKIFARTNEFQRSTRSKKFFTGTACRAAAND